MTRESYLTHSWLHTSDALLTRLLLRRAKAGEEREMVVLKNTSLVGWSGPAREVRLQAQAG
jgi:hypothetical protein